MVVKWSLYTLRSLICFRTMWFHMVVKYLQEFGVVVDCFRTMWFHMVVK